MLSQFVLFKIKREKYIFYHVCPSVCLPRRSIAAVAAPAGLLLSAPRAGDIDRQLRAPCSRRRRSAANARGVTLTADAQHRLVRTVVVDVKEKEAEGKEGKEKEEEEEVFNQGSIVKTCLRFLVFL